MTQKRSTLAISLVVLAIFAFGHAVEFAFIHPRNAPALILGVFEELLILFEAASASFGTVGIGPPLII